MNLKRQIFVVHRTKKNIKKNSWNYEKKSKKEKKRKHQTRTKEWQAKIRFEQHIKLNS